MDVSTQRMLERARARRQKLDAQLKNAGQDVTHKRSPLKESNSSQFVKVTTEVEVVLNSPDPVKNVHVSPTKVEVYGTKQRDAAVISPKISQSEDLEDTENNRERNIRSQLKRLGALYSDSQISSPIHRTENKFAVESDTAKFGKCTARVARLAALADNIKQWEDDLSHPSCALKSEDQKVEERIGQDDIRCSKQGQENPHKAPFSNKGSKTDVLTKSPTTSQIDRKFFPKKVEWDNKVLQLLEAQGFTRSVSNACLVYDYSNHSSQDSNDDSSQRTEASKNFIQKSPVKKPTGQISQWTSITGKFSENDTNLQTGKTTSVLKEKSVEGDFKTESLHSIQSSKNTKGEKSSPSKAEKSSGNPKNTEGSPRKMEKSFGSPWKTEGSSTNVGKPLGSPSKVGTPLGSPQKVPIGSPKAGSVLHKASLFESSSPTKKVKDPAELPISERMALFERNKGQALIPKAAFSMPVPSKYLEGKDGAVSPEKRKVPLKENSNHKALGSQCTNKNYVEQPAESNMGNVSNKVLSCKNIFEPSKSDTANSSLQLEQLERKKELEMLRNRWNKNKNLASDPDEKEVQNKDKPVPVPPPLPGFDSSSNQKCISVLPQVTQMIPKSLVTKSMEMREDFHAVHNTKINESPTKLKDYSDLCKIKKIRVSPPKPGKLYPCLSDIEVTTETESEFPDETERDSISESSMASDSDDGNTSFGREILEAAGIHKTEHQVQKNLTDSSESDISETAALADIDGCIEEALEGYDSSSDSDKEGPTPPKRSRDSSRSPQKDKRTSNQSPNSKPSQSFRYTAGGHSSSASPQKSPSKTRGSPSKCSIAMKVVDGDQEMPLMHSVSFYRRQQNLAMKNTPVKQIVRLPEIVNEKKVELNSSNEEEEVQKKIVALLEEVSKQQTIISQASQALNLCTSTVEFSGSAEQVEGERLLLLATQKRQAILHEIQRLKVEGSLKPLSDAGSPSFSLDKGSLLVSNIALSLKKDYVRKLSSDDTCYHFVCLIKSQEQVLVTKVIAATPQNLQDNCNLIWDTVLRLDNLYSDFKVTLEVYSLQTRKEMLPHNVKYHIGNKKESGKSWLTPKKQKHDSRLVMPTVQSPAGPSAVRTSEFRMAGYVVFSLREIGRTQFTLNKVSYSSPLEGNIQLKMKSELSIDVSERGFLTMFEDVSGFGAWHRRWFVLKGSYLAYWKYPDDESKVPIGQIDLNTCITEKIGLVSRDICARPNTFLLETVKSAEPDDKESLVVVKYNDQTMIRNLLSADTKEERLLWCNQLNKALTMLRAWGKK